MSLRFGFAGLFLELAGSYAMFYFSVCTPRPCLSRVAADRSKKINAYVVCLRALSQVLRVFGAVLSGPKICTASLAQRMAAALRLLQSS